MKLDTLLNATEMGPLLVFLYHHGVVTWDEETSGLRPANFSTKAAIIPVLRDFVNSFASKDLVQRTKDLVTNISTNPSVDTVKALLDEVACCTTVQMDNNFPEAAYHAVLERAMGDIASEVTCEHEFKAGNYPGKRGTIPESEPIWWLLSPLALR
jgi:hypothetical protein